MARRSSSVSGLRLRRAIAAVLWRSDFAELLLSLPRVRPVSRAPSAHAGMACVLRPYRAWLWRQRALVLCARAMLAAAVYVVASPVFLSRLLPSAPAALVWLPAILIVLGGLWLSLANRPSIHETACWLDRRFDLHDRLGTAIEQSAAAREGSLAARQVAAAMDAMDRVPCAPMDVRQRGPWALAVAALAAGLISIVLPGRVTPVAQSASSSRTAGRVTGIPSGPLARSTPDGLLQVHAPLQTPATSSGPGVRSGSRAAAPSVPLLSASLQIRLGPDSSSTTQQGAGGLPRIGDLAAGARHSAASAKQRPATNAPGQSSQRRPGSAASRSAEPQSSAQQGNGGGQSGQAQANTNDQSGQLSQQQLDTGAQTLPTQAPAGSSSSGQQVGSGQTRAQSPPQLSGRRGAAQVNPFGADPSSPKPRSSQPPQTGGMKPARPGQAQRSSPRGSTGRQQGVAPGSAGDARDGRPEGRSGSSSLMPPGGSPSRGARGNRSGPTHTTTIQVEGQPTTGSGGGQGPDLVRVVPFGAQPGEALQGPGGGSATVEGYVPEQTFLITPDLQRLVGAYFNSGPGS